MLIYNSRNKGVTLIVLTSGIYSVKPFKAFLEYQMSKDKTTALLAIKIWNFILS